ncbi:MAG: phosphotransferase [Vicinamibacteria bacterium]|nr:phosphotransferase [Vicinamibacteria bacterium]
MITGAGLDIRLSEYLRTHKGPTDVDALSGDASTRRYFRLTPKEGASSIVALYPDPFDATATPFYTVGDALIQMGLPVPKLLDHDGALGIYEQEDLGDLTLQHVLNQATAPQKIDFYREAIDEIITAQREAPKVPQRAICFHTAFDIEKLSWELHYFEKHFLELHCRVDLSVEDRSKLAEGFHSLAAQIASWPRVLCHRDYHSRNLMLHKGRLFWIDYQDARMGPATYDLASLLRDSYVTLDEDFVQDRAEEFRQKGVPDETRETFRQRFELMSIQRNLKALGTFGYMAVVRGNPVYLPYIPGTLAHVKRNLDRHHELASLASVLRRHIEELK